ncbi:MAG: AI-2E family transporter [Isosphaeraceae bacterium]
MPARTSKTLIQGAEVRTLVGFAIVAFLYFTGEVFKPLAMAILLAFALYPIARRLEKLGLPRAASIAMTLLMVLGLIAGVGYGVTKQLASLAAGIPQYQGNIEAKLRTVFNLGADTSSTSSRLSAMIHEMTDRLGQQVQDPEQSEEPSTAEEKAATAPVKVQVVEEPSFQERARTSVGPYLEALGIFSFVLILVMFMLMRREDLRDRIVALFGHRHIGLTTRTMEEISNRLTRYLATFILVNSSYGLVIGVGLSWIGVPYSVLWGFLAAFLRFIPYVGPATAFAMPTIFSAAFFPGWREVVEVLALFGVVEVVLNSFLEPVVYGKTTGTSALGLLIAAMFWTWLWGVVGLFLATPLTVCLAVIGKYVPSLRFFATLLGEEVELRPHLRFYQRIVALDRVGATAVVTAELKQHTPLEVFDSMLLPALARGEQDSERGALDEGERALLLHVTTDILDGLDRSAGERPPAASTLVGLAADPFDMLALRMLGYGLRESGVEMIVLADADSPWKFREKLVELKPSAVAISQFPAGDPAGARYLVRRLKAQLSGVTPIVVGYWRRGKSAESRRLLDAGAAAVVPSIQEARDRSLRILSPAEIERPEAAPLPA